MVYLLIFIISGIALDQTGIELVSADREMSLYVSNMLGQFLVFAIYLYHYRNVVNIIVMNIQLA
jgi:hypothetical protein